VFDPGSDEQGVAGSELAAPSVMRQDAGAGDDEMEFITVMRGLFIPFNGCMKAQLGVPFGMGLQVPLQTPGRVGQL
jgi:hypothetical protein